MTAETTVVEDEPTLDMSPDPISALPSAKPIRRFAPELIEETTRSSTSIKTQQEPSSDTGSHSNATQGATVNMTNGNTPRPLTKPMRRFVPVPIETTFDSYRVANTYPHGPAPEPTPDPSPTTSQYSLALSSTEAPVASETTRATEEEKPRRRFAPQLIETTRRVRRAGQDGPATKPIDKTDITPGTNHIYAPKPKRKQGASRLKHNGTGVVHAAAEVDDDCPPRFLGPRRQRSMKPHPNTRRATRSDSYQPELDTIFSSESGNNSEDNEDDNEAVAPALNLGAPADHGDTWSTRSYDLRNRRESCDEEFSGYLLGVAAREAHRQREFEQALSAFPNGMPPQGVEHFFVRDNSEDDLQLGDDETPLRHGPSQLLRRKSTDPGWAVKEMRAHAEKLAKLRAETTWSFDDNSDQYEIAPPPEDPLWTTTVRRESHDSNSASTMSPFLSAVHSPPLLARVPLVQEKPFAPLPATGLRASPFAMPFASHAHEVEDCELNKMRKAASPPMLGAELVFRTCPSPQYTRMEPYHPYVHFEQPEETPRDPYGATGLWRGYCLAQTNKTKAPTIQPPQLLHTPGTCSPGGPLPSGFSASVHENDTQSPTLTLGDKRTTLHKQTLSGLDERLEKEMARKEREEALLVEFNDAFVTQVYNYLSLGYPATARAFDDELSKISGICVEELRKDDMPRVGTGFMRQMEIHPSCGSMDSHSTDSSGEDTLASPFLDEKKPRHQPPRWKALKLYIHEWARQHPALNNGDDSSNLAWGVRARRGSWAI